MDPATILAVSQLVASVSALVAAVGAVLVSLRNSVKIQEVHVATNSMKDELVAAVGKQQRSEGVIEGVASAAKAASDVSAGEAKAK